MNSSAYNIFAFGACSRKSQFRSPTRWPYMLVLSTRGQFVARLMLSVSGSMPRCLWIDASVSPDRCLGVSGSMLGRLRIDAWVSPDRCLGVSGSMPRCLRIDALVSPDRCLGVSGLMLSVSGCVPAFPVLSKFNNIARIGPYEFGGVSRATPPSHWLNSISSC